MHLTAETICHVDARPLSHMVLMRCPDTFTKCVDASVFPQLLNPASVAAGFHDKLGEDHHPPFPTGGALWVALEVPGQFCHTR